MLSTTALTTPARAHLTGRPSDAPFTRNKFLYDTPQGIHGEHTDSKRKWTHRLVFFKWSVADGKSFPNVRVFIKE